MRLCEVPRWDVVYMYYGTSDCTAIVPESEILYAPEFWRWLLKHEVRRVPGYVYRYYFV